jgi:hypothetical protein
LIYVADDFSLLNLLTSKVNMKTLEHQMLNIWRLTIALRSPYGYGCKYFAPTRLHLSSTPLNEALISLHQILPNFQRENKLQKVQCVVLTDGEANCLPYHIEVKRGSESELILVFVVFLLDKLFFVIVRSERLISLGMSIINLLKF